MLAEHAETRIQHVQAGIKRNRSAFVSQYI